MDPNSQPPISTPQNLYQSAPEQPSKNLPSGKSGSSKILLFGLLSIIVIAGLVGTGYFLGAKKSATVVSHSQMAKTSPTPTPVEKSTYKDSYLGYSITYPKTWAFRRTYGPDIQKLASTDIMSGFDLTYNLYVGTTPYTQATVVVNVLDAHGLTDVQTWIDKYDPNYPKSGRKYQTTYNNSYSAIAWTDVESDKDYEYMYFIAGNYVFRINGSEIKGFSEDKDFHDILFALKP